MSKFLVDAHLPYRLVVAMRGRGIDVHHTLDLPNANASKDREINACSTREKRIVITKDVDFAQSFALHQRPYKLLLVTTGNIGNNDLLKLFENHLAEIIHTFQTHSFVELTRSNIIIRV